MAVSEQDKQTLRHILSYAEKEEKSVQDSREEAYWQGKKDGIRISQVLLLGDRDSANLIISTGGQDMIEDDEYEIARKLAMKEFKPNVEK